MPTRFDKYRFKDGKTALSERTFNPIFQDVDNRIAALEGVEISWEGAVNALNEIGLERIDGIVSVSAGKLDDAAVQAEALVAYMDIASNSSIANAEAVLNTLLSTTTANLAALQIPAPSGVGDAAKVPTINDAGNGFVLSLPKTIVLNAPPDAGTVTLAVGVTNGQLAVVDGYGVYKYESSNTDAADGETVIQPSSGSGRWVLIAPSWDFVWAYMSVVIDNLQTQITALGGG
jgi:hypothetical protein